MFFEEGIYMTIYTASLSQSMAFLQCIFPMKYGYLNATKVLLIIVSVFLFLISKLSLIILM